ncbi:unnamed protein product [Dovyalis caffra]|uniref:Uncharacterized protein n=1 Tax=Dovyalis caffra TaxID=77055 RepID=A0AAV1RYN1_9ROSI|nr:unnamed protein product [Dovyalis caffra]
MYRYGRGIRFLSYTACKRTDNTAWDPTVSLDLNHPSLVLLEKCKTRDHFKQILCQIMRSSKLIGKTFPMSRLIYFSAISHPGNLDLAITLFNHFTPNPNLYIYNTLISAFSSLKKIESFYLYGVLLSSGVCPDKQTLLYLLQAVNFISQVKQIHCQAIVTGLFSFGYLQNTLTKVYLENGLVRLARQVFEKMPSPDVVSFNIMVVGYAKKGFGLEAMRLFHEMVGLGLEPDEYTILGLLVSCGQLGDVKFGKAVHGWMERRKSIISSNLILGNALLDMYVKCQELELALRTFSALKEKDVVSWNMIIAGCAKVGELEQARMFFNQMPCRDIVSWNSLITGYAYRGDFAMVNELMTDMVIENVIPDTVTVIGLVSAAAETGALNQGRWAHGRVIRMQIKLDAFLGSTLIDMYCKCGSIETAFRVFKEVNKKDVTVWTTMITGFAFHGYGSKALELFSEMHEDVSPDNVTFVSVLSACSHSGLVDQGMKVFSSMKDYCIEPGVEHYGCLVDLLARSGRLPEAKDIIDQMPMKPSRSIWGAILNACQAQGDVEMAEIASRELLNLDPEEEGGYTLLSNIYAASGRWSYSKKIRETMESRGVKKTAGYSSVVVDGVIHDFISSDKSHPGWMDIRSILNCLKNEMKLGADFTLALNTC